MKNSILSTVVFCGLVALNPAMHAQKTQIINGGNPRPQIINGGNPRPQIINGGNPRPTVATTSSTSVLPAWVQTVLTVFHLM